MKSLKLFCVCLSVIFLFCGCSTTDQTKTAEDDTSIVYEQELETESMSEVQETSNTNAFATVDMKNLGGASDSAESKTELSVEDYIKKLENSNVAASAMFLSPDDPDCFSPLIYNGGDFVFYYQIGSSTATEYNIGFTLNGVYQDIKVEHGGNVTGYAIMHKVSLSAGENKVLKIMLRPNIGKAGDVLQFCNATISSTQTKITQDDYSYSGSDHELSNTLPADFVMNSDSTNSVSVNSSYKNVTIGNYSTNLRKHFTARNETEELCQMVIYNDLEKIVYKDDDIYKTLLFTPIIEAQASVSYPLTIAMSGKPGTTQRLSLYVNDELIPAFDGKYYADVKMEKGKQTTVNLTIDTSKLDTWNNIYCITYTHNAGAMDPYVLNQSSVYVLKVIK